MAQATLVRPYDPMWPAWFETLKTRLELALRDVPHAVEHVGSTAVPGMVAKPIIDMDVVVERADFARTRDALGRLGYTHQGDIGIPDREAFDLADPHLKASLPPHHLYVCIQGTPELLKHVAFRDFMRTHAEWVRALSAHKLDLCERHANDRQAYIDGKSNMVQEITNLAAQETDHGSD
jgi:GrpB-like predicted nucleotidyltransferase (UPF0157 family)